MIGHYVNAHPQNVSLASVGQKDTERGLCSPGPFIVEKVTRAEGL